MSSDHLVAGRYRLERRIGAGAMGQVWAATDERLRRPVAVKLVDLTLASDASVGERFQREAYATAQLSHPNIVTIFDAGTDGTTAYLVMELLTGQSVAERVRAAGPLPLDEVRRVAGEVARALEATHAIGVVHRDIKPANVMLAGTSVKLLDFGIAQISADAAHATLTAPASTVGTAAYMSPEQAQGRRAGPASDIYSLGCLLMTMLTGQPPFTGAHAFEVAHAQIADTPPRVSSRRADVPWELDDLVRRMLAKDPTQRPGAAAVRARLAGEPQGYVPPVVAGASAGAAAGRGAAAGAAAGRGAAAGASAVTGANDATQVVARTGPAGTAVLPPGATASVGGYVPPVTSGPRNAPGPPAAHGPGLPSAVRTPVGPGHGAPAHGRDTGWFRRGVKAVVVTVAVLLLVLVAWSLVSQLFSRLIPSAADDVATTRPAASASAAPIPTFEPPPLPSIPLPTSLPTAWPSLPGLPTLPSAGDVARRTAVEGVSLALAQIADPDVRAELQASWADVTPSVLNGQDAAGSLARFTAEVDDALDHGLSLPEYLAIRVALSSVGAAV